MKIFKQLSKKYLPWKRPKKKLSSQSFLATTSYHFKAQRYDQKAAVHQNRGDLETQERDYRTKNNSMTTTDRTKVHIGQCHNSNVMKRR